MIVVSNTSPILNLAAIGTLQHGHKVYVVEPNQIASKHGVAAILCHALARHGKLK